MTYVINFISGKSLVSSLVYAELKCNGYITEYVQEYAKQLVWFKKLDKLNNQYYVSTKQYEMINLLVELRDLDYVVMDGALLLGLCYNDIYKSNVSNIEKTRSMIIEKNSKFKNIYIYLERNENVKYEQQGRVQNESEARDIDKYLKKMLKELDIEYKSFKSSKESLEEIIKYIKKCSI
jgi:hypothetical protein